MGSVTRQSCQGMLRFVTQNPRGSHVLLAHATTLATGPPSVHHSAALGQPAQSVQEGHAEAVKKKIPS